jgi:hypothetical protein
MTTKSVTGTSSGARSMTAPNDVVVLPKLAWQPSPNVSERSPGIVPYLIVAHRPAGSYHGSADWLCNPRALASAHVLTEGKRHRGRWGDAACPVGQESVGLCVVQQRLEMVVKTLRSVREQIASDWQALDKRIFGTAPTG